MCFEAVRWGRFGLKDVNTHVRAACTYILDKAQFERYNIWNCKRGCVTMVRSMTGYGRFESDLSGRNISAEIKSVNHRYFEFSCRIPASMGFLEEKLKSYVRSRVSRGKIDLYLSMEAQEDENCTVSVNTALANGYARAFEQLAEITGSTQKLTPDVLARFQGVLSVRKGETDEQAVWNEVLAVVSVAVDKFIAMRELEGQKLREDILSKVENILDMTEKVEQKAPETVEKYRSRLEAKLAEILGDKSIDQQRLITEAAIFADKIAVDEETVRLRSHMAQISSLLDSDEPIGRKLDFVLQESNREINTIGSKSQNTDISKLVVDVKSELEKIREQIQNIE